MSHPQTHPDTELLELANAMPQIVFVADALGSISFVNHQWREYTGQVVTASPNFEEVVHPDDFGRLIAQWSHSTTTRTPLQIEFRMLRAADAEYRWFLMRSVPIFEASGLMVRWYGTATDIHQQKETEAQLRHLEHQRRLALDSAELGSWHVDPGTMALTTDDRFRAIFGVTTNAVGFETAIGVIHPDDQLRVRDAVVAAMNPQHPAPYAIEYRVIHPDGSFVWVFAKGRANFEGDSDRRLVSFDGTLADITERKRADEERERLRLEVTTERERLADLFEHAPSFMAALHGPEHRFERTNARYNDLIGQRPVIGKTVADALPEVVGQGFVELLDNVYRSGEPSGGLAVPILLQREAGQPPQQRYVDFIYQPLRDHRGPTGILVQGVDVTERKIAEAAMEDADRRKDEFLATLAHELRNPLAPLRNSLRVLQTSGNAPASAAPILAIMERQLGQLVRLVNDLLEVSRIATGKVELQRGPIDTAAIVRQAVETCRPSIDANQNVLTITEIGAPSSVNGDLIRLSQLVSNLLLNSVKFSPTGSAIAVTLAQESDQAVIRVRDSGIGIDREAHQKIFDMFSQIDQSLERARGGLGIGLSLARRLVEMHEGRLDVESQGLGTGSEFIVRLPLSTGIDDTVGSIAARDPRARRRRRILIADDNVDSAVSLQMLLEASGHDVRRAADGRDALVVAEAFRPDVILMDIGMPVLNGYEVCRSIRRQPWAASTTIVALTGWGQESDRLKAEAAGFEHHFVKPLDVDRLERVLSSVDD